LPRGLWKTASEFADESMQGMKSISSEEHERTLSGDKLDAFFLAELNGLAADSPIASRAIHPDPTNACFGAICDHSVCD